MIIREAKYEDKKVLNELIQGLLEYERDNYDDLIRDNIKMSTYFDIHLKLKNEIVLVCEIDNEIVGYIQSILADENKVVKEKCALISSLFVKEKYRNMHIGRTLIEEMFIRLKERDIHNIEINNLYDNKAAAYLYESLGFKVFKENRRLKI